MDADQNHLSFSQRMALAPTTKPVQIESIDKELLNSLWNVITIHCFSGFHNKTVYDRLAGSNYYGLAERIYADFYKAAVDQLPRKWSEFKSIIRESYFKMAWHRVYSFLEFMVELNHRNTGVAIASECNKVLARENSAFRFVAGKVTAITSSDEIEEIEKAIYESSDYRGVRTHLQTSLAMLTDRLNPDYRNSIKESISAVESLAKQLTGNNSTTLTPALSELEKHHNLHPALKSAFSSLYGWTSNADGIRHGLMDEPNLSQADARFMLICCSAFINFAIDSTRD